MSSEQNVSRDPVESRPAKSLEREGTWTIHMLNGNTLTVPVERDGTGRRHPETYEEGGAITFVWADGRRQVFSYAGLSMAEFTPEKLVAHAF